MGNSNSSCNVEECKIRRTCLEHGPPRVNSAGRLAFLSDYSSSELRYYCGVKCRDSASGDECPCKNCDESCGPDNGCPCEPCRQLQVENRSAEEAGDAVYWDLGVGGTAADQSRFEEWLCEMEQSFHGYEEGNVDAVCATLDDVLPVRQLPNYAKQATLLSASEFYAALYPGKPIREVLALPTAPHTITILKDGRGAYVYPVLNYRNLHRIAEISKETNREEITAMAKNVKEHVKFPAVRNVLGRVSFFSTETNSFYCGGSLGAFTDGTDGHCGPTNGPMCAACALILGIGERRVPKRVEEKLPDVRQDLAGWRPLVYGGYHLQQRQHPAHAVWDPSRNPTNPIKRFTARAVSRADELYVLIRLAGFVTDIAREIAAYAIDVDTAENELLQLMKSPYVEFS